MYFEACDLVQRSLDHHGGYLGPDDCIISTTTLYTHTDTHTHTHRHTHIYIYTHRHTHTHTHRGSDNFIRNREMRGREVSHLSLIDSPSLPKHAQWAAADKE